MAGLDARVVRDALHDFTRKEFVRPARVSSMDGEAEYTFWHAVLRDVCYGQISRAPRAAKHRAAAGWLERQAGERVEDIAEVLAHHYGEALELARAAGEAGGAEAPARRFLVLAGDRALALDVGRAEAHYARALALAPPGSSSGRVSLPAGPRPPDRRGGSRRRRWRSKKRSPASGNGGTRSP